MSTETTVQNPDAITVDMIGNSADELRIRHLYERMRAGIIDGTQLTDVATVALLFLCDIASVSGFKPEIKQELVRNLGLALDQAEFQYNAERRANAPSQQPSGKPSGRLILPN